MTFFERWGWGDTGLTLAVMAGFSLAGLGAFAIFQDHTVQFYYVSDHGNATSRNGYCIDGYRNWWANDSGVFCSDDVQKTILVLKELNSAIPARREKVK